MFTLNRPIGPTKETSDIGVVYEVGKSLAASQFKERLRNVSLTKLRLQQMLHLDDRHIPLPIIRLYYEELQREPQQQNKESLMTYTMLLRDWHITKNKLNFIRDVTKLAVIFGKRFTDNLGVVEASLNNVHVTPQDVYETIMSNLYDEAEKRNVSLNEYLLLKYDEIYSQSPTWGMDSLQAFFPESRIRRRNLWNSFTVSFLLRLSKETLRTVTKLDGRSEFFTDSEPTWSRREGTPYARTAREIAEEDEIRRKLMEKLLSGDTSSNVDLPMPKITELSPVPENETKNDDGFQHAKKRRVNSTTQEEDETHTIDTSTFRTCYEKAIKSAVINSPVQIYETTTNDKTSPNVESFDKYEKQEVDSILTGEQFRLEQQLDQTSDLLSGINEPAGGTSAMIEQLEKNELDIEKALNDMRTNDEVKPNADANLAPRDDMLEEDEDEEDEESDGYEGENAQTYDSSDESEDDAV